MLTDTLYKALMTTGIGMLGIFMFMFLFWMIIIILHKSFPPTQEKSGE